MAEMLLNWVADTFARSDIIDLYFIVSDLVDIPLTEAEVCQTAYYDALTMHTLNSGAAGTDGGTPLGKLVL
jgi:hypothetical protein